MVDHGGRRSYRYGHAHGDAAVLAAHFVVVAGAGRRSITVAGFHHLHVMIGRSRHGSSRDAGSEQHGDRDEKRKELTNAQEGSE